MDLMRIAALSFVTEAAVLCMLMTQQVHHQPNCFEMEGFNY